MAPPVAPLRLRHAAFGAALLILVGSWQPVLVITAVLLAVQYWFSDQITLSAMRGELVGPEEEPRLYAILARLCAQADMPKPALAIVTGHEPGAFAAGRTPSHAVLCVTRGLTNRLADDEVEAVLARELSRLAHRDTFVITAAPLVAVLAGLLMRIPFHVAPLGGPGWHGNPALGAELIAIVLSVYALGLMLVRAIARSRELAADRGGAILTGQPTALAHALIKLDSAGVAIPTKDLRAQTTRDAHATSGAATRAAHRSGSLFSARPKLRARLDRLAELTAAPESPDRTFRAG